MIGAVLWAVGAVGVDEAARFVAHHRTGLTTALTAAGGWVAHRARRRVSNVGTHAAPRKPAAALEGEVATA